MKAGNGDAKPQTNKNKKKSYSFFLGGISYLVCGIVDAAENVVVDLRRRFDERCLDIGSHFCARLQENQTVLLRKLHLRQRETTLA